MGCSCKVATGKEQTEDMKHLSWCSKWNCTEHQLGLDISIVSKISWLKWKMTEGACSLGVEGLQSLQSVHVELRGHTSSVGQWSICHDPIITPRFNNAWPMKWSHSSSERVVLNRTCSFGKLQWMQKYHHHTYIPEDEDFFKSCDEGPLWNLLLWKWKCNGTLQSQTK